MHIDRWAFAAFPLVVSIMVVGYWIHFLSLYNAPSSATMDPIRAAFLNSMSKEDKEFLLKQEKQGD